MRHNGIMVYFHLINFEFLWNICAKIDASGCNILFPFTQQKSMIDSVIGGNAYISMQLLCLPILS
jgi:hypothetical protein